MQNQSSKKQDAIDEAEHSVQADDYQQDRNSEHHRNVESHDLALDDEGTQNR